jgi:hypothetical protein
VSTKSPQPEVFRGVKRMDVLDGASVSVRGLFSQLSGMGRHWRDPIEQVRWEARVGIGPASRKRGWMVPVQDGNRKLWLHVRVAESKRRAFGGCLGTRRR